ncbi:unnamed protein product, partial [Gulo gulo]
ENKANLLAPPPPGSSVSRPLPRLGRRVRELFQGTSGKVPVLPRYKVTDLSRHPPTLPPPHKLLQITARCSLRAMEPRAQKGWGFPLTLQAASFLIAPLPQPPLQSLGNASKLRFRNGQHFQGARRKDE